MTSSSLSYRPRLDGLRFIAIFFVLIEHFGSFLVRYFAAGYYGVDLFFVLSGFLITGILLKNTDQSPLESYRTFMGRRTLRIFPLYYLTLAVLLVLNLGPVLELFPWLVTYTFNYGATLYREAGNENPLYYLWSLSVEEQFYLLWPPLVLMLRKRPAALFYITCGMVALSYAQITFHLVPALNPFNYTGLLNRMGSLGLGAAGAIYTVWRPLPERVFRSAGAEVLVLALLVLSLTVSFKLRFVLMGLCSLFLVIKAAEFDFRIRPLDVFLQHRWITYVGMVSYGIYLFHVPIGLTMTTYVFDPIWTRIPFESLGALSVLQWHSWVIKLPLYSVVTIAVAFASFRWFERPILSLKDRWFGYEKKKPAAVLT